MGKIRSAILLLKSDRREFFAHIVENCHFLFSEKVYLRILYRILINRKLCLDNPKSFNEKLNWLKLYNRKPEYCIMVDKYAVKDYVASIIGEEHIIPCYRVWDAAKDISFDKLPNQFVLKTTHSGSAYFVCKDKSKIDEVAIRNKFRGALKLNLYYLTCEWPYKDVPPRVLAEKFMDDNTGEQLRDYKFYCFDGEPKFVYLSIKGDCIYENFYDMNFDPVFWINHGFPRHQPEFEKPLKFNEMIEIASALSRGIPFVRVDLYYIDSIVYFGELTFFDWGGMKAFTDYDTDLRLGRFIKLPSINKYHSES